MQINSLEDHLKGVRIDPSSAHNFSVPKDPNPKPQQKVAGVPTRTPINKQTALLISPVRCWLSQPPPEKSPSFDLKALDRVKAELKIERNDHAITRDSLGKARLDIKALNQVIGSLQCRLDSLRKALAQKEDVIRQLEDLTL